MTSADPQRTPGRSTGGRLRRTAGGLGLGLGLLAAAGSLLLELRPSANAGIGPYQIAVLSAGILAAVFGFVVYKNVLNAGVYFETVVRALAAEPRKPGPREWAGIALVSVVAMELALRLISQTDIDGNVYVMGRRLPPPHVPVESERMAIETYLNTPDSYLMYDPWLGWTIRPGSTSRDGLYQSNANGMRAPVDYARAPEPGVVRIALFGDSFTHGTDVDLEQTWGAQLQKLLAEQGYAVEILNFGVSGYGIDQAFLRWQREGRHYQPDIVVLGFYAEDALRDASIVRPFVSGLIDIPFSKPRFVLEGSELVLVNSPTVAPEDMPDLMANFENSPLRAYELHYPLRGSGDWWLNSRLVALGVEMASPRIIPYRLRAERLALDGDFVPLSQALIQAFAADVTAQGIPFVVVDIPDFHELSYYKAGKAQTYRLWLDEIDDYATLVETLPAFDNPDIESYFVSFAGHYSGAGNAVIAGRLADTLAAMLDASE